MKENDILQAQDVRFRYDTEQPNFAVDGVSMEVHRGEFVAVLGANGCGKSTLGRLLTMIEMPTGGELYYQGQDLLKHDPQAQKLRRQKIQIVFQNPYGSLNPRKKVGQILEEPLLINTSLSKEQRREKALSMMAKVGLKTEHYDRYPHMFSGGQRQRIAIARGLMLDPDVVIADEPVSALDVSVRAQVLNLMMDLQQDLGLSYVFISHDLSVVEHIADEVMVMYLGRCVEKGTKDQIFTNPRHPYTQALLSATPRLNPDDRRERIKLTGELPSPLNPPPGCAFNARCRRRFGPCTQLQPQLKDYGGQLVACFAVDQDENGEKPQRTDRFRRGIRVVFPLCGNAYLPFLILPERLFNKRRQSVYARSRWDGEAAEICQLSIRVFSTRRKRK